MSTLSLSHDLELTDLWGRAVGLDAEMRHEEALNVLAVRARGKPSAKVAAVVSSEIAHQALAQLQKENRREITGREKAAVAKLALLASSLPPDYSERRWAKLWRGFHAERGVTASAVPPTPPWDGMEGLQDAGELACSCSSERCTCSTEPPIAAEPHSGQARLASAIAEVVDASISARDDQLRERLVASPAPILFEPRINVHVPPQAPPNVTVAAPEVRVSLPEQRARSIRVEEEADGTRRYVAEDITEED